MVSGRESLFVIVSCLHAALIKHCLKTKGKQIPKPSINRPDLNPTENIRYANVRPEVFEKERCSVYDNKRIISFTYCDKLFEECCDDGCCRKQDTTELIFKVVLIIAVIISFLVFICCLICQNRTSPTRRPPSNWTNAESLIQVGPGNAGPPVAPSAPEEPATPPPSYDSVVATPFPAPNNKIPSYEDVIRGKSRTKS